MRARMARVASVVCGAWCVVWCVPRFAAWSVVCVRVRPRASSCFCRCLCIVCASWCACVRVPIIAHLPLPLPLPACMPASTRVHASAPASASVSAPVFASASPSASACIHRVGVLPYRSFAPSILPRRTSVSLGTPSRPLTCGTLVTCVAVAAVSLCLLPQAAAPTSPAERAALVDLYLATTVAPWVSRAGWDSHVNGTDPCDAGWEAVECTGAVGSSDRVV